MKLIYKKITLFILFVILLNTIITWYFYTFSSLTCNQAFNKQKAFDAHNNHIKYLIMGHSIANRALDDAIIPQSFNYASGAEHFPYTYYKLKHTLEQTNKKIDVIILPGELTFLQFSEEQLTANSAYWNNYFDYLEFGALKNQRLKYAAMYLKNTCFPYANFLNLALNGKNTLNLLTKCINLDNEKTKRIYSNLNESKKDSILNAFLKRNINSKQLTDSISILYVKKTIELCQKYQIPIVFVKLPVTQKYYNGIIKIIEQNKYNPNQLNTILTSNPKNKVIDFENLFFDCEDYFFDPVHLNIYGKKEISQVVSDSLEALFKYVK